MLKISQAQMAALSQQASEQFIADMMNHLRQYFPAMAWLLTAEELREQVINCIARAAHYQLTSQQQVCRYLNVAAYYGWDFDRNPDLVWMRKILHDTSLTHPGERLDHLVQTCLHRQGIEQHNLALRTQLGLIPVEKINEPEVANEYLGAEYLRQKVEPTTEKGPLSFNPLSYHLSKSLWQTPDALLNPNELKPAAPVWIDNSFSLLQRKSGERYVSN
jgi:hypothetical protein